jgi:hypothetical protein
MNVAAVIDALSRHKAEIVMLLRPSGDGWSAEDWRACFEERAGFLEHHGGLLRVEAEVQAFGAPGAASPNRLALWFCHSAPVNTAHGCTANAGPLGINRDGPKPIWPEGKWVRTGRLFGRPR